jgi:hypothetical protein
LARIKAAFEQAGILFTDGFGNDRGLGPFRQTRAIVPQFRPFCIAHLCGMKQAEEQCRFAMLHCEDIWETV